ncbi:MAG: DUF3368 domain-containing protein [Bacteroidota bacterium]
MLDKVVVSDTSCFIALTNIEGLSLLQKLYKQIYTTSIVIKEFGDKLPNWVKLIEVEDLQKQKLLEFQIDKGEASAVVMALEQSADLIIVDDNKARLVAKKLGLQVTGTLGIIKAKKAGVITLAKPLLENLRRTNFRISDDLLNEALMLAGE